MKKKNKRGEKGKKERRKGVWWRKFLVLSLAAIAIISGGLISWLLLTEKEISFEVAIKNPQLREVYIEKIVKKVGKPNSVKEIIYVDTQEEREFLEKEHGIICHPKGAMVAAGKIFGTEHVVAIFPYAFSGELFKKEEDFISNLLHEFRHTEVFSRGKVRGIPVSSFLTINGELNKKLFQDIFELDAYGMELERQADISSVYQNDLISGYIMYYTDIWNHEKTMEPEFIRFLKIQFFQPWMLKLPILRKEKVNGKEIWYLRLKTDKYYLPEEIIWRFQIGKGQPCHLFLTFLMRKLN